MQSGRVIGATPTAMETAFGWVLTGQTDDTMHSTSVAIHLVQCDLDNLLQRFWNLEEIPSRELMTSEEKDCEEFSRLHIIRTSRADM
jgi:hypothetical protein